MNNNTDMNKEESIYVFFKDKYPEWNLTSFEEWIHLNNSAEGMFTFIKEFRSTQLQIKK